jgi:hypothetical protein
MWDEFCEGIARDAHTIRREAEEMELAKSKKHRAEEDLLCQLVTAALPGLGAIASGVHLRGWRGRAVSIAEGMYLTSDGVFRDGSGVSMTEAAVLDQLSLTQIALVLAAEFEVQTGRRESTIKSIRKETAVLQAIVRALKAGRVDG